MSAETTIDLALPVAGYRILVVDDNGDAARTLGMMFDATGNEAVSLTMARRQLPRRTSSDPISY